MNGGTGNKPERTQAPRSNRRAKGGSRQAPEQQNAPESQPEGKEGTPESDYSPQREPEKPDKPVNGLTDPSVRDVRQHLAKSANGMLLCIKAAIYTSTKSSELGVGISPDHFSKLVASYWIRLDRAGLIDDLPTKPLELGD